MQNRRSGPRVLLCLLCLVAAAWVSAGLSFFGGPSPLESKPGVAPRKYDGSDIDPEELGKTEWEVQWWRDMKEQQESMSRKAAIEKERAGDADGESVKILLYLFGFLLFGTFLVFLPGYLGIR